MLLFFVKQLGDDHARGWQHRLSAPSLLTALQLFQSFKFVKASDSAAPAVAAVGDPVRSGSYESALILGGDGQDAASLGDVSLPECFTADYF